MNLQSPINSFNDNIVSNYINFNKLITNDVNTHHLIYGKYFNWIRKSGYFPNYLWKLFSIISLKFNDFMQITFKIEFFFKFCNPLFVEGRERYFYKGFKGDFFNCINYVEGTFFSENQLNTQISKINWIIRCFWVPFGGLNWVFLTNLWDFGFEKKINII